MTHFPRTAHRAFPHGPQRQRGAVLVVALIFLLLLTILAVSASGSSMLQLRMAGNLRNAQQASMSANTALRGAEWKLWTSANKVGHVLRCNSGSISSDGCIQHNAANPAYDPGGVVYHFRHAREWLSNAGIEYTGANGNTNYTDENMDTAQLAHNPRYIIEDMGLVKPPGAGPQHESGVSGPQNTGAGNLNLHAYRITARATGGSENTVRVHQSTFDAQTNN